MTTEEVFKTISAHMIKGIMIHEQMSQYYQFLGLDGYAECHEYHYLSESCTFHDLCKYYIIMYNKLLPDVRVEDPQVLPSSWFKYLRENVDANTKRNAIRTGLEKWMSWERDTRKLYEEMYHELMNLNEIAAAYEVQQLIKDVDQEVKDVERYYLNKQAVDYDMVYILDEQNKRKENYIIKKRELFLHR